MKPNERLQSLDVLRGMDMFMILCAGWSPLIFVCEAFGCPDCWLVRQCHHAAWGAGVTIIDLIFPTFLFIAGVTFPYSLARQHEQGGATREVAWKILSRIVLLFALGLMYNHVLDFDWANNAIWSVIGRIGLAWGAAALVWLAGARRLGIAVSALLLMGWWLLCRFVPSPEAAPGTDAMATMQSSFAYWMDVNVLTLSHKYEGAFATVAMVPTALFGMLTGDFLRGASISSARKAAVLLAAGAAAVVLAFVWEAIPYGVPRIKECWSSSYALYAGGIAVGCLGIVYWMVDVMGWRRGFFFFRVIGVNPLMIYLLSWTILRWENEKAYFFGGLMRIFPGPIMNCIAEWGTLGLFWLLLLWMYNRKIFLKV